MKYKEIAYILSCLVFLILTIIAGIHIVTIIRRTKYQSFPNTALLLETLDDEPMATLSVNLQFPLLPHFVAIKNYAENEGVEASLIKAQVIEAEPIEFVESGSVRIPVYALGEAGLKL